MSALQTFSFTTASLAANATTDINQTGFTNLAWILRVKIPPSVAGAQMQLQLHRAAARGAAQLVWSSESISTTVALEDPVRQDAGVITHIGAPGHPVFYEDQGAGSLLHCRLINGTAAQTFAIEIDWLPAGVFGLRCGIATTGAVDGVNTIYTLPDSPDVTTYKVKLYGSFGTILETSNGYGFTRSGAVCTLGANVPAPQTGDPQPIADYVAL